MPDYCLHENTTGVNCVEEESGLYSHQEQLTKTGNTEALALVFA